MNRIGFALLLVSVPCAAWADTCLESNGKPPKTGLSGMLRLGYFIGPRRPPDGSPTFYVLDLSTPTCLTGSNGEPVLPKVTSVQVEVPDKQRKASLDLLRDKRVTVRFSSVFERSEDYHRRPMVGVVEAVAPEQ